MRYSAGNIQSSQQSTRELLWKEFPVIRNIHEIHCLLNTFASLLFVLYIKAAEVINILIYSQFINQIKALEDETDISFSESGQLVFIHFIHSLSFKEIGARSRGI